MIFPGSRNELRASNAMVFPLSPKNVSLTLAVLLACLVGPVLAACTSDSSTLGQYRKGRTLHFSVVSMERTPELRYATCDVLDGSDPPACDPAGNRRSWSISPTRSGMELVILRAKVENHTAVRAIINVSRESAELRDFANATYFPVAVTEVAWRDYRGAPEAVVRVNKGDCFDGTRALVDAGTSVKWQSESGERQILSFQDSSVPIGAAGNVELAPNASVAGTFTSEGTYGYSCSGEDGRARLAELRVAAPEPDGEYIDRTTRFLHGSFELPQGHGLDGFLVFEVPAGTVFRDVRWRAGDSILFGF
jgi:plastocyanin